MCLSGLVMWGPHGQPRSPPLFTYNARLAHVGPSRHLHRGTHQGPIWAMYMVYGTHVGSPRFIPCGLLVYGTHVGSPRFTPCGLLVYGTHVGSPRFIPCGLLVYGTHVGSPRFTPCGLLVYGTHVGSHRFTPCGLLFIY